MKPGMVVWKYKIHFTLYLGHLGFNCHPLSPNGRDWMTARSCHVGWSGAILLKVWISYANLRCHTSKNPENWNMKTKNSPSYGIDKAWFTSARIPQDGEVYFNFFPSVQLFIHCALYSQNSTFLEKRLYFINVGQDLRHIPLFRFHLYNWSIKLRESQ